MSPHCCKGQDQNVSTFKNYQLRQTENSVPLILHTWKDIQTMYLYTKIKKKHINHNQITTVLLCWSRTMNFTTFYIWPLFPLLPAIPTKVALNNQLWTQFTNSSRTLLCVYLNMQRWFLKISLVSYACIRITLETFGRVCLAQFLRKRLIDSRGPRNFCFNKFPM